MTGPRVFNHARDRAHLIQRKCQRNVRLNPAHRPAASGSRGTPRGAGPPRLVRQADAPRLIRVSFQWRPAEGAWGAPFGALVLAVLLEDVVGQLLLLGSHAVEDAVHDPEDGAQE